MLHFNDPKRKFIQQKLDFLKDFSILIESGSYIKGEMERKFEDRLKQYLNVDFRVGNITDEELPEGDVCFVRQVLQHLSNEAIANFILKIKKNINI